MIQAQDPIADRLDDGEIRVRWQARADQPGARLYVGTSPGEIARDEHAGELQDGELVLRGLDTSTRHYFELVPSDGGPGHIFAERLIPLAGTANFRDLGGYPAADGRRVAWGKLYRSDHLAELTDEDLAYLTHLDLRLICDFRGDEETAKQPNRLPAQNPPLQINPSIMGTAMQPSEIHAAIAGGNPDKLDFSTLLVDGNRFMATKALEQYRQMFRRLEDEAYVPLLFHCTAGKDRTGVAAALILLTLGVSEDVIMEDYLLTAAYTEGRIEQHLATARQNLAPGADLEAIRPIMSVRREFLQAAFDGIYEEYGDVDNYLRRAMLISDDMRTLLQTRLLT